jgi:hypothetical protein
MSLREPAVTPMARDNRVVNLWNNILSKFWNTLDVQGLGYCSVRERKSRLYLVVHKVGIQSKQSVDHEASRTSHVRMIQVLADGVKEHVFTKENVIGFKIAPSSESISNSKFHIRVILSLSMG